MNLGILYAFGALFSWAFGDFFIQKTIRATNIVKSLFFIGFAGAFGILPFVLDDIRTVWSEPEKWPLLMLIAGVVILAALANFMGMKLGKLSVVMPLNGIEMPITILLCVLVAREHLPFYFYLIMAVVALGIFLTLISDIRGLKRLHWERGVGFALLGGIGLGATNFLIGFGSQQTGPLFIIWFTHTAAMLFSLAVLLFEGNFRKLVDGVWRNPAIILLQSVLDNAAWIFYAFATTLIPISIAETISESYIPVGVLLGLFINKEKIKAHQIAGIILAFAGVTLLSVLEG